ncbi:uncharacterized protein LOC135488536 [Lineus longissimus]|uniref:uncharacterized protein LOC135488536 n=1 Tax=Lineus longissimus TaxID=88925 RepID=UPI00315D1CB3
MTADVLKENYENITKFNYIVGQLEGNALDAVAGIHASGDNLTTLIEVLEERFGQTRKIIRAHVTNLLDIPNPSYNHASLRGFYNKVMGDMRSLETLKVDTHECSSVLVPILERKLPKILREKMGTSDQGDRFDLSKFMKSFNTH